MGVADPSAIAPRGVAPGVAAMAAAVAAATAAAEGIIEEADDAEDDVIGVSSQRDLFFAASPPAGVAVIALADVAV